MTPVPTNPISPMPPANHDVAIAATVNGLTGWWKEVAQFSAVGIIGVLLFVMLYMMNNQVKDFRADQNWYHEKVFENIGAANAQSAQRDAKITELQLKLDEANRKLDKLEWRLALSGSPLASWFPPDPKPKDKGKD